MYTLNKDGQAVLASITRTPYLKKAIEFIEEFVHQAKSLKIGDKIVFDEIYTILCSLQSSVESYLEGRKKKGLCVRFIARA